MVAFPFKKTLPCSLMVWASSSDFFISLAASSSMFLSFASRNQRNHSSPTKQRSSENLNSGFSDDLSCAYGNKATPPNVNRHLIFYHFFYTPPPLPNAPLSTQQGS
jgi:hypothetical protein